MDLSERQKAKARAFRSDLNVQQGAATIKAIEDALAMPVDSTVFIQRAVAMADARGVGDAARALIAAAAPCAAWPRP